MGGQDDGDAGLPELAEGGRRLLYRYDVKAERTGIGRLLAGLAAEGLTVADLDTEASSLEEIFMGLVHDDAARQAAE